MRNNIYRSVLIQHFLGNGKDGLTSLELVALGLLVLDGHEYTQHLVVGGAFAYNEFHSITVRLVYFLYLRHHD